MKKQSGSNKDKKTAKDTVNKLKMIGSTQSENKENTISGKIITDSKANESLTKLLNKTESSAKIVFKKALPANTNALKTKFTKNAFSHYVTKK